MRRLMPLAALLLSACGGGGGGASSGPGSASQVPSACPIASTPATPSWKDHIYPMLHSPTCGSTTVSCHGGASAAGRLDYSADGPTLFNALVNVDSTFTPSGSATWKYIAPGDSAHSWLYEKVHPAAAGQPGLGANNPVGSQMPLGSSLCGATTDALKLWIDQGAQNN